MSASRSCASASTSSRSRRRREQRHDPLRALEREVGGFAERPAPAAVDRRAAAPRTGRRSAAAARAPRSAATRACSRSAGTCRPRAGRSDRPCRAARPTRGRRRSSNRELALRAGARAAARPRRRDVRPPCATPLRRARRPPTIRAAASARARPPPPAAARAAVDDGREHRARFVEVLRRDRAVSGLPATRAKNALEHVVDELTLPPRVHHLFVVRLFFEAQHVLREELERAAEVRLERADRPRARLPAGRRSRETRATPPEAVRAVRMLAQSRADSPSSVRTGSGSSGQRFVGDRPAPLVDGLEHCRQPRARDLVELDRRDDQRSSSSVKVETLTRREADTSRSRNRASAAARRSFPTASRALRAGGRVEDVAPRPLRPVALDEADDATCRRSRRSAPPDRRAGGRRPRSTRERTSLPRSSAAPQPPDRRRPTSRS